MGAEGIGWIRPSLSTGWMSIAKDRGRSISGARPDSFRAPPGSQERRRSRCPIRNPARSWRFPCRI